MYSIFRKYLDNFFYYFEKVEVPFSDLFCMILRGIVSLNTLDKIFGIHFRYLVVIKNQSFSANTSFIRIEYDTHYFNL